MGRLASHQRASADHFLERVIFLLTETVAGVGKPAYTCNQFLLVLYVVQAGGLTQAELARKLGVDDSTITRAFRKLGPPPEGSGCIEKIDGKVVATAHVQKALAKILDTF